MVQTASLSFQQQQQQRNDDDNGDDDENWWEQTENKVRQPHIKVKLYAKELKCNCAWDAEQNIFTKAI